MKKYLVLGVVVLLLTGCRGAMVEVPPAHRGKQLTDSGYTGGLKTPSTFTLPWAMYITPKLVIAEVSDVQKKEELMIFMPKDQLNLKCDVRGTFAIASDEARIDSIFERVTPDATKNSNVLSISFDKVYATYAEQVVRRRTREVLTKYTIEYIVSNLELVSQEMEVAIKADLKNTPISCTQAGLSNVQPPDVIVQAQEQKKKRQIEIERAEADKMVKIAEADAKLEVEKKEQQIDLLQAETQVLVDRKLAEGVSEAFVLQRGFKALEELMKSGNHVIVIPQEAFRNPGLLVGVTEEAFQRLRDGKKTLPVVK